MSAQISHHLLLCGTSKKSLCCEADEGLKSWKKLKLVLQELNLEDPNRPEGIVLRSKVDCLRICSAGPILLIWPEGIWYHNVSADRIEPIVKGHVVEGTPIKEWVFKETPLNNSTNKLH
ncbi:MULTISPECIES: (2Fe-2S) ferredoxin domain-containing protein [Prochlorococcus]|uniref:Ferredoxin n=1 Tax=Prochlorococcus marinus (strain SARG / CCMP1375 / SS120) TaxID=167539 RepID=Q7VB61_PROMA|nr:MULTISPECIES: (2Fe-2S) ferredoxin domain-containing protein [Prochlorococcus]AAQ00282.1 Ferredoxin [Prochlorococcus marinus subsp. marinus str. CCMP1375]KGG14093.1 Ferredoxin [Prochlorococcus marinus str. LG]KGG20739.1 Ferredoxin [Prochlorococcus marinus str. SS2]KGG25140.1 Ferredoxin [Prochlorococcus marinus str. SS35]KGG33308.1 Ferredoxin [Prochlorococcus marinus str. SS51]